ncbi:prepilin-type N-terminal cleavage/methylation domain-containing protein [Vibrio sp. JC009]|uniref:type IV pilus modification PilV family protein n=1 Tax=Vibrio sp. JC009 TaxID=2912314 RepID=UPI0023B19091|nr:prepilin-type N-terminal cleavage/methylation domain-containing protein [Vibrio sp. JC009]WED21299.1 prepilin-type N-terminal cleavage/methylation domain-containing protein [Vibrio sp. JC009]
MTSNMRGFSLIEVLIAMFVLSVGVMGLIRLQMYAEHSSENSANRFQALFIAENRLEQFKGFSQPGGTGTLRFQDITSAEERIDETFKLQVRVNNLTAQPWQEFAGGVYAKRIQIEVYWEDRRGETKQVALQTLISRFN